MRGKLYRGAWYAVWTEGGRTRRRSLRTKDRAVAERTLADLRRGDAASRRETVGEIMYAYLQEKDQSAIDPARLRVAWKALEPTFASLRPDHIDRPLCRVHIARRRQEGRKDGTIAKELNTLRAGLRWHDPRTPAIFEMPPAVQPRERYLTRAEYGRLLKACETQPHLHLFVVLALATAGRSQAILGLTWDRVDFARGVVRLAEDPHRRKGRATVPITDSARAALEAVYDVRTCDSVVEWAGRRVGSIKKAFKAACARAGLEGVTPHDLRRTAAVWMAEAGVSMAEIAAYLGHSDDRVTSKHYARFSPDYLRRAARALESDQ